MSRRIHPLGFKIDKLSIRQMHDLKEILETTGSILQGFLCQPRFANDKADGGLNPVGNIIDDFVDAILCEAGDVVDLVRNAPARNAEDAERKFAILASDYIDGLSNPASCAAEISKIAADLSLDGKQATPPPINPKYPGSTAIDEINAAADLFRTVRLALHAGESPGLITSQDIASAGYVLTQALDLFEPALKALKERGLS